MIDCFVELGQPRRPFLAENALKETFHRRSAELHPDVSGGDAERFARLNTAFNTLRDPVLRLRHLIELEFPNQLKRQQAVAADLSELFARICEVRHRVSELRQRLTAASTPLAKALLAPGKMALIDEVRNIDAEVAALRDAALDAVHALDENWAARDDGTAEALAALHARLSYLTRWSSGLREDLVSLAE